MGCKKKNSSKYTKKLIPKKYKTNIILYLNKKLRKIDMYKYSLMNIFIINLEMFLKINYNKKIQI
jgi:hypothetical protein